jgi:hypothetical protein
VIRRPLAAVAVLLATAAGAAAQLPDLRGGAGITFEAYSFGSAEEVDLRRVDLTTLPVAAAVSLTQRVELSVRGAFATAQLQRADGQDVSLSGLTDTEVRVTTGLARDRLRLGFVALLPTGQTELTAEEMDLSGVIAADLLPFAISHWGTGGGIGVSAAMASPLGYDMAVGVSAGYVVAREFEPLAEEGFAYRPGNQLHLRAGLDRTFGRAGKASLQLAWQQFGRDLSGGANLYQAGDRLQAVASYSFPVGHLGSGVAYAGYLRRQGGQFTEVVQLRPAQDLFYVGGGLRRPFRDLMLLPSLDIRVVGNEDGLEQGYTITAGTGAEIPVGRALLVPTARARFGSLTIRQGFESGFSGVELGASLRAGRKTP